MNHPHHVLTDQWSEVCDDAAVPFALQTIGGALLNYGDEAPQGDHTTGLLIKSGDIVTRHIPGRLWARKPPGSQYETTGLTIFRGAIQ
jgi:hypothetical protein